MKQIFAVLSLIFVLAACEAQSTPTATPPPTPTSRPLTEVTVVMGYIPNVQFAPFFVADEKGYFAQEGLKVKYNWGFEFDGVKLVGANQSDFAIVSGDQIIQARAQGVPIVYVANWYNAFPIEVISLKEKNIVAPQDLIGKKVGLPGLFGASYTAWRALLATQKIDPNRVNVQNIGFTQAQALTQGAVDAAVVYANNEPVQLRLAGKELNEIKTWEYAQLIGNGVATNEQTIQQRPQIVQAFVRALLNGISDTIGDPRAAFDISMRAFPDFGGANTQASEAVLNASIPLWQNSKIGETKAEDWQAMEKFMKDAEFIQRDVDVNTAFTNQFLQ